MLTKDNTQYIYGLSPAQEGMFYHYLLKQDQEAYVQQVSFTLTGEIDPRRLQAATDRLVERYDVLRTVFTEKAGKRLFQIVLKRIEGYFFYRDFSGTPDAADRLRSFKAADRAKGVDLIQGPAFRISVGRTSGQTCELTWTYHHIILDGWCLSRLAEEFFGYVASPDAGNAVFGPPARPYKAYIDWLDKQDKQAALDFWQSYLEGYDRPAVLEDPKVAKRFDRYEPQVDRAALTAAETTQLNGYARAATCTVHSVVEGLWAVLLGKYNRQREVVFGTVVSGRPAELPGADRIIGLFINTVPVRLAVDEDAPLAALFEQARRDHFSTSRYHYASLADVQNASALKQNLLDHLLVFENYPEAASVAGVADPSLPFRVSGTETFEQTHYNLTLIFYPGEELTVVARYNAAFYRPAFIRELLSQLIRLLRQVAAQGVTHVKELSFGGDPYAWMRQLQPGKPDREWLSLYDSFGRSLRAAPTAVAVCCDGHLYSYADLDAMAGAVAGFLQHHCPAQELVPVVAGPTVQFIAAVLGVLRAGKAFLPVTNTDPAERILYIFRDCSAATILFDGASAGKRAELEMLSGAMNAFAIADIIAQNHPPAAPSPKRPGDVAYVIYTSGTTGRPKGVIVEEKSIVNYVDWAGEYYLRGGKLNFPLFTPVGFDLTLTSLFVPLRAGSRIVVYENFSRNQDLLPIVTDGAVEIIKLTPSHLSLLKASIPAKGLLGSGVRKIIVGGEELLAAHCAALREWFGPAVEIYNEYGPTEATVGCMVHPAGEAADEAHVAVPIGLPINRSGVMLLDAARRTVGDYMPGELYIAGEGLARGYLNNPELTHQKFVGSPAERLYRTGDLAAGAADGNLLYLGRADDQVKVRGFRVEPEEIAFHLKQHPSVRDGLVTVYQTGREAGLCAYYLPLGHLEPDALRDHLSTRLPSYMVPSYFVPISAITLTANGKTDFTALPAPLPDAPAGPLRNDTDRRLAHLWSEVLRVDQEKIGLASDFFRLGGHSLRATLLKSAIQKAFEVKLELAELFRKTTLGQMSDHIRRAVRSRTATLVPVEQKEYYPQSSAQKRIFFLGHFENIGTSYSIVSVLKAGADLDIARLDESVRKLAARHEGLRTTFWMHDGQPVQTVHPHVVVRLEEITGLPADFEKAPRRYIDPFVRPFDLARLPLFRVAYSRLPDGQYIILITLHHIISDGTSMELLQEDLVHYYNGAASKPMPVQYKDFAHREAVLRKLGKIRSQEGYWLNRLAGYPPPLRLPADFEQYGDFTFTGDVYRARFDEQETRLISQIATAYNTTTYINLLAVFYIVLHKYTREEDIIIGTGSTGRSHADLQGVVGMFINMLALRNYPHPGKRFGAFLGEVRQSVLEALQNQDFPFEELIEKLQVRRNASHNPLFNASLVVHNHHRAAPGEGFALKPVYYARDTAKFELSIFLIEREHAIDVEIEYCNALFTAASIARLMGHFRAVLQQVAGDYHTRLGDIDLVTEAEKCTLPVTGLHLPARLPGPALLHGLFEEQAAKLPDGPALVWEGNPHTYAEIDQKANQLANYLIAQGGVAPNGPVGLLLAHPVHQFVAILGVLKAGGAYLPIDPYLPENRIRYIIRDSNLGMLLSEKRFIKRLNNLQWECNNLDAFVCLDAGEVHFEIEPDPSELMDQNLWDYVASSATDQVTGGGWVNSYTGLPFTPQEMEEYGDNAFKKLSPHLDASKRVLEIGVASGITMYRLAPLVHRYVGTDLSEGMIRNNRQYTERHQLGNIQLHCLAAHEVDRISGEGPFDLIILNSVVQCFPGHNYLRDVLRKCLALVSDGGLIFVGDVMDLSRKGELLKSTGAAQEAATGRVKTDFSAELFLSGNFFTDLSHLLPGIASVACTRKLFTIENELTRYRYDVLLRKGSPAADPPRPRKIQAGAPDVARYGTDKPRVAAEPDDLAYLIYTSGSTGQPKGVLVNHDSIVNTLLCRKEAYQLSSASKCLQLFSYAFDGYLTAAFTPLAAGSTLVVVQQQQLKDLVYLEKLIEKERVDHFICVPTLLGALLHQCRPESLQSLRVITVAGEKIDKALLDKVRREYPAIEIVNEYGVTEAAVMSAVNRRQEKQEKVHLGEAAWNTALLVVNPEGQLQPLLAEGELVIAGNGLARGYLNNPELTAARFAVYPPGGRMYRTGDLARRTAEGIEYRGRTDSQVKLRGLRIEPAEISHYLKKHPRVRDAFVTLVGPAGRDPYLCGYVVADEDPATFGLQEYVQEWLPAYMVPARLVQLDHLPRLPSGKVDRHRLPDPALDAPRSVSAARNAVDEKLIHLWSEVLNVDKRLVGPESNFFQLGGHSLKATVLHARIHREFRVNLPLAAIFRHARLSDLADEISRAFVSGYVAVKPAELKEYYRLTPAQERLFLFQQMEKESVAYNIVHAFRVTGLPKERLRQILDALVQRHESLRTSFHALRGGPVARLHAHFPVAFAEKTIAPEELPEAIRNFSRPFDLSAPPLLRVTYLTVRDSLPVLLVEIHHILFDTLSLKVFIEEISLLAQDKPLPPLPVQYKDYAEWFAFSLDRDRLADQRQYWQSQLKDGLPVLDLPYNFQFPDGRDYTGQYEELVFDQTDLAALQKLAARLNLSLYVILMAGITLLLRAICRQEDLVIGSTMAARRRPELYALVGMFVNNVVFRLKARKEVKLRHLLADLQAQVLQVLENQEFPVEKAGGTSRKPALAEGPVQVMFNFIPKEELPDNVAGLFGEGFDQYVGTSAKFDLTFQAFEGKDALKLRIEYSPSLFRPSTIRCWLQYLKHLLLAFETSLDTPLAGLHLLPLPERNRLAGLFDYTAVHYPREKTIVDVFSEQVATWPGRTAVEYQGVEVTYAELDRKANQLANQLIHRGYAGQLIGVLLPRSAGIVVAMLGILKAGGAYLPLDPDYPAARLAYLLADAGVTTLVSSRQVGYSAGGEQQCLLEDCDAYPDTPPAVAVRPSDPAYVIYTSGTTGRPKGVIIEHANVVRLLCHDQSLFAFSEKSVWTVFHSHCFDFSVWEIFGPLFFGGKMIMVSRETARDPEAFLQLLRTRRVTVLNQTPSAFYNLERAEMRQEAGTLALEYLIFGGEALQTVQLKRWAARYPGTRIINMFGITETTVHVTFREVSPEDMDHNVSNIGKPIPTSSCVLLDEEGLPVPPGVPGELYVGGAGVGRGYLNRPELTAQRFVPHPFAAGQVLYRSGDFARILPDGNLEYIGRQDHQVKINGHRIETGEIEQHLLNLTAVRSAHVLARESAGNQVLVAYLVCDAEVPAAEIREYLKKRVPAYMVPAYFVHLPAIPLDPNGKIDRARLPLPQSSLPDKAFSPPESEAEMRICTIWADILKVPAHSLGGEANFFEVGGTSLSAAKVLYEVREAFRVDIPFREFLQYPTIREMHKLVQAAQWLEKGTPSGIKAGKKISI